ncbi:MAG: hypothetical protein B7X56_05400 [Burkholderiales bacterium 34-67-9]|nr:MAG: hypothetical protein B7X56_05400 [Burkholderiales bacterium 34-67-9]
MANVSFNPALTTSPANSFLQQTEGYVQGAFFNDDPAIRLSLSSGQLASSVAQPIWGGMAISELVPTVNTNALGNTLELSTAVTNLTGFTVFNQGYNMVIVPGNSVQIATAGMTAMYFRLGSNAQIVVQCSTALVTAVEGGFTNQETLWDFTNQLLIPYTTGTALPVKILRVNNNSKIVSYNSGTGAVSWTTGPAAVIQI